MKHIAAPLGGFDTAPFFQQADIERPFELAEGSYDAIVVLHVLEHLAAPEATLRRLLPAIHEARSIVGALVLLATGELAVEVAS